MPSVTKVNVIPIYDLYNLRLYKYSKISRVLEYLHERLKYGEKTPVIIFFKNNKVHSVIVLGTKGITEQHYEKIKELEQVSGLKAYYYVPSNGKYVKYPLALGIIEKENYEDWDEWDKYEIEQGLKEP